MQRSRISPPISSPQSEFDALRYVGPESPCPYLEARLCRYEAYELDSISPEKYEALMSLGFRRSGRVVYRPRCRACNQCQPLRVFTDRFRPSRSMMRTLRRNADIVVHSGPPKPSLPKFAVYQAYLDDRHDGVMSRGFADFQEFLYSSPTETLEFVYCFEDRILGVSIVDCCPNGLSSVYMYFDPQFEKRGLGTFSVLYEIQWCKERGLPFYYLGYFVAGSPKMQYKSRFRPHEILLAPGDWVAFD